jgi:hypothetical protein
MIRNEEIETAGNQKNLHKEDITVIVVSCGVFCNTSFSRKAIVRRLFSDNANEL